MRNFSEIIRLNEEAEIVPVKKGLIGEDKTKFNIAQKLASLVNKYSGSEEFTLMPRPAFILVGSEQHPMAMLMGEGGYDGHCIFADYSPMGSRLIYFSKIDWEAKEQKFDISMDSGQIGIVNLIKTFCALAFKAPIKEALTADKKIIEDPDPEKRAKDQAWTGNFLAGKRTGTMSPNLTPELMEEIKNNLTELIKKGVDIYDIAWDVHVNKSRSQYAEAIHFGEGKALFGERYLQQLLLTLARTLGVQTEEDSDVPVGRQSLLQILGVSSADFNKAKNDFEKARLSILDAVGDLAAFIKASPEKKDEMVSGPRQQAIKRFLIITGKGGLGKTTMIRKEFDRLGLRENIDYVMQSSTSGAPTNIYNICYKHNGKIIVFDDPTDVFDSVSLWKNLFSGGNYYGTPAAPAKSDTGEYYDVSIVKTDRDRFYKEAGMTPYEFDRDENGDWRVTYGGLTKALDQYDYNYSEKSNTTGTDRLRAIKRANKIKADMANAKPKLPSKFEFTGCIVLIMNANDASLVRMAGSDNWNAIKTRSLPIEYTAPGIVLWESLKEMLIKQRDDSSLTEDMTDIPKSRIDEFCEQGDMIIKDGKHMAVTFRILDNVNIAMRHGRDWVPVFEQSSRSSALTGKVEQPTDLWL